MNKIFEADRRAMTTINNYRREFIALSIILAITVSLVIQLSGGSEPDPQMGNSCPVSSDDTDGIRSNGSEPLSTSEPEFVGLFGVIEKDRLFTYARKPAVDPNRIIVCRITHYGSPLFPPSNYVARWPMTLTSASRWAEELGLDGICAVWTTTPWYNRIRDEQPPILQVDGHGLFLAVDRVGHGTDVDLYVRDSSVPLFAHYKNVVEIPWPDENPNMVTQADQQSAE